MKLIETIEREVPGMIGTKEGSKDTSVKVVGELFEENIFMPGSEKSNARVNFVNADSKHLIASIYLKGIVDKEKLEAAVDGYVEKINEILPCL